MALNKRSRLHKLLLTFDESGKYVTGEALFQEGAWDTETNDWFGDPTDKEYPVTNITPEGKKALNDVLGVVTSKALEAAETWKKDLANLSAVNLDIRNQLTVSEQHRDMAFASRDNFAKLYKEAQGDLINECQRRDEIIASQKALSERIPRLIRKMFGAI